MTMTMEACYSTFAMPGVGLNTSTVCFHCALCNVSFRKQKFLKMHCDGLFHRDRLILTKAAASNNQKGEESSSGLIESTTLQPSSSSGSGSISGFITAVSNESQNRAFQESVERWNTGDSYSQGLISDISSKCNFSKAEHINLPPESPDFNSASSADVIQRPDGKDLVDSTGVSEVKVPFSCKLCQIQTSDESSLKIHTSSLEHCKLFLLRQHELGMKEFKMQFGDVPFTRILSENIPAPPDDFDPNMIRIYHSAVVTNLNCRACQRLCRTLEEWFQHAYDLSHCQKLKELLELHGVFLFLALFGDLPLPESLLPVSVSNGVSQSSGDVNSNESVISRQKLSGTLNVIDHNFEGSNIELEQLVIDEERSSSALSSKCDFGDKNHEVDSLPTIDLFSSFLNKTINHFSLESIKSLVTSETRSSSDDHNSNTDAPWIMGGALNDPEDLDIVEEGSCFSKPFCSTIKAVDAGNLVVDEVLDNISSNISENMLTSFAQDAAVLVESDLAKDFEDGTCDVSSIPVHLSSFGKSPPAVKKVTTVDSTDSPWDNLVAVPRIDLDEDGEIEGQAIPVLPSCNRSTKPSGRNFRCLRGILSELNLCQKSKGRSGVGSKIVSARSRYLERRCGVRVTNIVAIKNERRLSLIDVPMASLDLSGSSDSCYVSSSTSDPIVSSSLVSSGCMLSCGTPPSLNCSNLPETGSYIVGPVCGKDFRCHCPVSTSSNLFSSCSCVASSPVSAASSVLASSDYRVTSSYSSRIFESQLSGTSDDYSSKLAPRVDSESDSAQRSVDTGKDHLAYGDCTLKDSANFQLNMHNVFGSEFLNDVATSSSVLSVSPTEVESSIMNLGVGSRLGLLVPEKSFANAVRTSCENVHIGDNFAEPSFNKDLEPDLDVEVIHHSCEQSKDCSATSDSMISERFCDYISNAVKFDESPESPVNSPLPPEPPDASTTVEVGSREEGLSAMTGPVLIPFTLNNLELLTCDADKTSKTGEISSALQTDSSSTKTFSNAKNLDSGLLTETDGIRTEDEGSETVTTVSKTGKLSEVSANGLLQSSQPLSCISRKIKDEKVDETASSETVKSVSEGLNSMSCVNILSSGRKLPEVMNSAHLQSVSMNCDVTSTSCTSELLYSNCVNSTKSSVTEPFESYVSAIKAVSDVKLKPSEQIGDHLSNSKNFISVTEAIVCEPSRPLVSQVVANAQIPALVSIKATSTHRFSSYVVTTANSVAPVQPLISITSPVRQSSEYICADSSVINSVPIFSCALSNNSSYLPAANITVASEALNSVTAPELISKPFAVRAKRRKSRLKMMSNTFTAILPTEEIQSTRFSQSCLPMRPMDVGTISSALMDVSKTVPPFTESTSATCINPASNASEMKSSRRHLMVKRWCHESMLKMMSKRNVAILPSEEIQPSRFSQGSMLMESMDIGTVSSALMTVPPFTEATSVTCINPASNASLMESFRQGLMVGKKRRKSMLEMMSNTNIAVLPTEEMQPTRFPQGSSILIEPTDIGTVASATMSPSKTVPAFAAATSVTCINPAFNASERESFRRGLMVGNRRRKLLLKMMSNRNVAILPTEEIQPTNFSQGCMLMGPMDVGTVSSSTMSSSETFPVFSAATSVACINPPDVIPTAPALVKTKNIRILTKRSGIPTLMSKATKTVSVSVRQGNTYRKLKESSYGMSVSGNDEALYSLLYRSSENEALKADCVSTSESKTDFIFSTLVQEENLSKILKSSYSSSYTSGVVSKIPTMVQIGAVNKRLKRPMPSASASKIGKTSLPLMEVKLATNIFQSDGSSTSLSNASNQVLPLMQVETPYMIPTNSNTSSSNIGKKIPSLVQIETGKMIQKQGECDSFSSKSNYSFIKARIAKKKFKKGTISASLSCQKLPSVVNGSTAETVPLLTSHCSKSSACGNSVKSEFTSLCQGSTRSESSFNLGTQFEQCSPTHLSKSWEIMGPTDACTNSSSSSNVSEIVPAVTSVVCINPPASDASKKESSSQVLKEKKDDCCTVQVNKAMPPLVKMKNISIISKRSGTPTLMSKDSKTVSASFNQGNADRKSLEGSYGISVSENDMTSSSLLQGSSGNKALKADCASASQSKTNFTSSTLVKEENVDKILKSTSFNSSTSGIVNKVPAVVQVGSMDKSLRSSSPSASVSKTDFMSSKTLVKEENVSKNLKGSSSSSSGVESKVPAEVRVDAMNKSLRSSSPSASVSKTDFTSSKTLVKEENVSKILKSTSLSSSTSGVVSKVPAVVQVGTMDKSLRSSSPSASVSKTNFTSSKTLVKEENVGKTLKGSSSSSSGVESKVPAVVRVDAMNKSLRSSSPSVSVLKTNFTPSKTLVKEENVGKILKGSSSSTSGVVSKAPAVVRVDAMNKSLRSSSPSASVSKANLTSSTLVKKENVVKILEGSSSCSSTSEVVRKVPAVVRVGTVDKSLKSITPSSSQSKTDFTSSTLVKEENVSKILKSTSLGSSTSGVVSKVPAVVQVGTIDKSLRSSSPSTSVSKANFTSSKTLVNEKNVGKILKSTSSSSSTSGVVSKVSAVVRVGTVNKKLKSSSPSISVSKTCKTASTLLQAQPNDKIQKEGIINSFASKTCTDTKDTVKTLNKSSTSTAATVSLSTKESPLLERSTYYQTAPSTSHGSRSLRGRGGLGKSRFSFNRRDAPRSDTRFGLRGRFEYYKNSADRMNFPGPSHNDFGDNSGNQRLLSPESYVHDRDCHSSKRPHQSFRQDYGPLPKVPRLMEENNIFTNRFKDQDYRGSEDQNYRSFAPDDRLVFHFLKRLNYIASDLIVPESLKVNYSSIESSMFFDTLSRQDRDRVYLLSRITGVENSRVLLRVANGLASLDMTVLERYSDLRLRCVNMGLGLGEIMLNLLDALWEGFKRQLF